LDVGQGRIEQDSIGNAHRGVTLLDEIQHCPT
jgi:hypothetical protein